MNMPAHADREREIALVELVNRVLDRGVVVTGEVVVSVADIDLLYLNLSLVLSSVETLMDRGHGGGRRSESGRRQAEGGTAAAAGS